MDVRTAELVRSMDWTPRSPRGLGSLREDLVRVRASLRTRGERTALLQLAATLLDWAFGGSAAVRAQALVEIAELLAQDLGHREGPMRLYELALGLAPCDFRITSRAREAFGKEQLARVEWLYLVQARAVERLPSATPADRAQTLRRLADLRAELGSVSSAIESYEKLVELSPDLSSVRRLAELLAERGEPGDAEDAEALFALTADLGAPPRPRTTKTARLPAPKLPLPKLPVYVPPLPEAVAAPHAPPLPREALPTPLPPAPRPVSLALEVLTLDAAPEPSTGALESVAEALTTPVASTPTLVLGKAPWPITEARIHGALDARITQLAPGSPIPLSRPRPRAVVKPPARRARWLRRAGIAAATAVALFGFLLTPLGSGLAVTLWSMRHRAEPIAAAENAIEVQERTALADPRDEGAVPAVTRSEELLPAGVSVAIEAAPLEVRMPEAGAPEPVLTPEARVKRVRGGKLAVPKAQRSLERALAQVTCKGERRAPGALDVVLRISPAGRVTAVEGRAARVACVREPLESARFPRGRTGARVEASLVLRRVPAR